MALAPCRWTGSARLLVEQDGPKVPAFRKSFLVLSEVVKYSQAIPRHPPTGSMSKTMSSLARFTRDVVVTIARNATTIDRNTRWVREQDEEWYPTKLSDGITVMAFCDDGCGNGQDCYSTTYRTCVQRFCVDCDDRISTGLACDDCRIDLLDPLRYRPRSRGGGECLGGSNQFRRVARRTSHHWRTRHQPPGS